MPSPLLRALAAGIVLWAAVIFLVLGPLVPTGDGPLLGFLGTVALFYPTADTELRKWLHRRNSLPRVAAAEARKRWDILGLRAHVDGISSQAISLFSWWHLAAYFLGLSLVALGVAASSVS